MPLPIDLDKDIAVGISLPIEAGANGYFRQTYTTMEQVVSNVVNLLLTIPGERYMQPEFGSKLHEYLFEQFDEGVIDDITDSIENALSTWLPYVNIEELKVLDGFDMESESNIHIGGEQKPHTIYVSLIISIEADPDTHTTITFSGDSETGQVSVSSDLQNGAGGSQPVDNQTTKQIYDKIKKHTPPSL